MRNILIICWSTLLLASTLLSQNYRGAELRTLESFQYGRFETSLKTSQGEGYLSSFFTYNTDYPTTEWTEIDFEILGRWPDNIDINVIDEMGSHLRQHPMDLNVHLDYHRYAIEWTPEYVAWFFDGEEMFRQTGDHILDLDQAGKLMMNIWTPVFADWVGVVDTRIFPRFASYDWVSYAAYTPDSGSIGSANNFTPTWVDSFDVFDETRWEKSANHTWNGNNSLLVEENIVFRDGKMILCLTLPGEEGYQDIHPPAILWARAQTLDSILVRFSEKVDPALANAAGTYTIPGSAIRSASLHPDEMTVSLLLEAPLSGSAVTVYALGIKDQADPQNTNLGAFGAIQLPQPLDLPIRIDCAGPGLQGFLPDQVWNAATEYGHEGGNYQVEAGYPDYADTELDSVLASALNRFSRYHIRLRPGRFDIRFHFAENHYTAAGQRTFQIEVEDSLIVAELDVYAQTGNQGVYTLELNDWEITDGTLDLRVAAVEYGLGYQSAGPFINAIEVDGEYWLGLNEPITPQEFGFRNAFPNPFNDSTQLVFSLPVPQAVNISVYNILGSHVMDLAAGRYSAGEHSILLQATELSSGLYIIKFESEAFSQNRKVLYLK